jgi:hypothetical protein
MIYDILTHEDRVQQMKHTIRHVWHQLTDEEIEACEERRDVFFLAVRKKHGLKRAQAEIMLNEIKQRLQRVA